MQFENDSVPKFANDYLSERRWSEKLPVKLQIGPIFFLLGTRYRYACLAAQLGKETEKLKNPSYHEKTKKKKKQQTNKRPLHDVKLACNVAPAFSSITRPWYTIWVLHEHETLSLT